jgi:Ca2+-dependent lipid-binding protein
MNPNPSFKWVSFLPDQCVGSCRHSYKSGYFSFKFSIYDQSKEGRPIDFKQFPAWSKPASKRSNPVKIRAYIYQCQDLPAADAEGTSDPYIVAWDTTAEVKKTKVIEDNCNPLFYETLELEYEVDKVDDLESYPPFILDAYDFDDGIFDHEPDYLGRAVIEPEDCAIVMQKDFELCKEH